MRTLRSRLLGSVATGAAALAIGGALAVGLGSPAVAVTDIGELVDTCASQTVCQFDGASISNASALAGSIPEGAQVIVIPADGVEGLSANDVASQVRSATGADTVIVIEDRPAADRFGVAAGDRTTSLQEALYSQGQADGGLAVASIAGELIPASAPADSAAASPILVIGSAALVSAVVIVGGLALLLRRRKKAAGREVAGNRRIAKELSAALDGADGEYVGRAIADLRERAAAYPDLGAQLVSLADHISELIVRARKRGSDQQARLLQSQYKDTLSKLLKALGDDYYGDILANPRFWNDAEQRLGEVRGAVQSVDAQAVENIKQVNESRDLEFQVALDSLTRTVDEARLSDVYTDRQQQ